MVKTIAIDGPAASGKTTLAKTLAEHLNYVFFDTGVMYRAVTLAAILAGLDLNDEAAVTQLAETVQIDVAPASKDDGRTNDILIDGVDSTWKIRDAEVDANVSVVAAYPGVRAALTAQQRRIGMRGGVVMVGRDIGTVVLPEAEFKIYLDASVEERARRRYEECASRGEMISLENVLASMRQRDDIDSHREVAPLRPADDAVILVSDGKQAGEVFEQVTKIIETTGFLS